MSSARAFALIAGHGAALLWIVQDVQSEHSMFRPSALPLAGQTATIALLGLTLAYGCMVASRPKVKAALEITSALLFFGLVALWIAVVGFGASLWTPF